MPTGLDLSSTLNGFLTTSLLSYVYSQTLGWKDYVNSWVGFTNVRNRFIFTTLEQNNTLCMDIGLLHYAKFIRCYGLHIIVYIIKLYRLYG